MVNGCHAPKRILDSFHRPKHKWAGPFFDHVKTPFCSDLDADCDIGNEPLNEHYSSYFERDYPILIGLMLGAQCPFRAQGGLAFLWSAKKRDTQLPAPALLSQRAT